MEERYAVTPATHPVTGSIRPPGSKSLTNRALIIAALAEGRSHLTGVLDCQDTQVMIESLRRLGLTVTHDQTHCEVFIEGCAGKPPAQQAELYLENSGTSIRFLTALCATGQGQYRLDGNERMRQRPIGDLVRALQEMGCDVRCELNNDCPPVVMDAKGIPGGDVQIASHLSSQYLSGLLMAAPCAQSPMDIRIPGRLVSQPYVEMTLGVMARFGVVVDNSRSDHYQVHPQLYRGHDYDIEPDASAASYFMGAAAITGGRVTIEGLSAYALQGDIGFVDVLEEMGCRVDRDPKSITVTGGNLRGVDVDMNAISDTAQTLAVVAVFASSPTRIRNVAHMRHKETDRILALVNELRRMGIHAEEHPDGLTIHPGVPQPAIIETYDDHRMAMSFALVGLKVDGIGIDNPGCTAKTYPNFFHDLEKLYLRHV